MSRKSKVYSKNATSMHTEDTIKEIGDDMELENNDDKFNIEKTYTHLCQLSLLHKQCHSHHNHRQYQINLSFFSYHVITLESS